MTKWDSASIIFLCFTHVPLTAQSEGSFSMRGQVIEASSGRPIPDLKLTLATDTFRLINGAATSGSDGRFTFTGLAAGRYILTTSLSGETIHYHELPGLSLDLVKVGPEEHSEVIFPLSFHPSVSGIVRDELGDPIAGARIDVYQASWREGGIVFDSELPAATDDTGHYRVPALTIGSYVVCASVIDPGGNEKFRIAAPWQGVIDFMSRPASV